MRAQYFHDIIDVGVEQARQMANLVEGAHDVTHSSSYRSARAALNTRIEVDAAKEIARVRLGNRNKKDGAKGAVPSE